VPSEEPINIGRHNFDDIDEHLDGLTFRSEEGTGPEYEEFMKN
jgi:hypothetical protein